MSTRDAIRRANEAVDDATVENSAGLTFRAWYELADREVINLVGLGLDDLPDGPSRDAWNDGTPPDEYAAEQLDAAGYVE